MVEYWGGGFLQKLCSFSWGSSCEETVHTSFPHLQSPTEECRNSVFCYWLISLTCSLLVSQPEPDGNSPGWLMSHLCFGLTILCRETWTCFQVYARPFSVYILIAVQLSCRKSNLNFWKLGNYINCLTWVTVGSKTKRGKGFAWSTVVSNESLLFGILGQWEGQMGSWEPRKSWVFRVLLYSDSSFSFSTSMDE